MSSWRVDSTLFLQPIMGMPRLVLHRLRGVMFDEVWKLKEIIERVVTSIYVKDVHCCIPELYASAVNRVHM